MALQVPLPSTPRRQKCVKDIPLRREQRGVAIGLRAFVSTPVFLAEAGSLNRDCLGNVLKISIFYKSSLRINSLCSRFCAIFFLTQDFVHNNVHTSGESQTQQTSHPDCCLHSPSSGACKGHLSATPSERPWHWRMRREPGCLLGSQASSCFSRLPRKNFQGTECSPM